GIWQCRARSLPLLVLTSFLSPTHQGSYPRTLTIATTRLQKSSPASREEEPEMFQQLSIGSHQFLSRLVLFTSLLGLLTVFSAWLSKTSAPEAGAAASTTQVKSTQLRENSMPSLQGTQARDFLQQQAQYESLMQAVTAVRFGLKPYDVDPFDSSRKNG